MRQFEVSERNLSFNTGPCEVQRVHVDRETLWRISVSKSYLVSQTFLPVAKAVRSVSYQPLSASCTRLTACFVGFPAVSYTCSKKSWSILTSLVKFGISCFTAWSTQNNCWRRSLVVGGCIDNRSFRRWGPYRILSAEVRHSDQWICLAKKMH